MQIAKIILISLVAALAVGVLGGMFVGRYLRKKAESNRKPVLSLRQRIACIASVVIGVALIVTGVVVVPNFIEEPLPDSQSVEEMEFAPGGAGNAGGSVRFGGRVNGGMFVMG